MTKIAASERVSTLIEATKTVFETYERHHNRVIKEVTDLVDAEMHVIGKPIWSTTKKADPSCGKVVGYLFGLDEEEGPLHIIVEGFVCENDAGETVEMSCEDSVFEDPSKNAPKKGRKNAKK